MKVEYSTRATADLRKVAVDSRPFGEAVSAAIEQRLREIVAHIAKHPEGAPQVVLSRPGHNLINQRLGFQDIGATRVRGRHGFGIGRSIVLALLISMVKFPVFPR